MACGGAKALDIGVVAAQAVDLVPPERVTRSGGPHCFAGPVERAGRATFVRQGHIPPTTPPRQLPHERTDEFRARTQADVHRVQASGAEGRILEIGRQGMVNRGAEQGVQARGLVSRHGERMADSRSSSSSMAREIRSLTST